MHCEAANKEGDDKWDKGIDGRQQGFITYLSYWSAPFHMECCG